MELIPADARAHAVDVLDRLEARLAPEHERMSAMPVPATPRDHFTARTWVTRPRPGVDRMSSAWLIRRFIDPTASVGFGDTPPEGGAEIPFDMFGVEFGHHGSSCTFETFVERFGLSTPGLGWIARIVHTLDLKDETSPPLPEAPGVGRLIEGLRLAYADDGELLERGMTLFEALYRAYPGEPAARRRRRRGRS
jgi:hypothetical protein